LCKSLRAAAADIDLGGKNRLSLFCLHKTAAGAGAARAFWQTYRLIGRRRDYHA